MAVMAGVLNETQRRTLEAVCDTFVPAVEYDGSDEAVRALHRRARPPTWRSPRRSRA